MTTTNQHPITPPPELVGKWLKEFYGAETMPGMAPGEASLHIATQSAQWGADQELEACCECLRQEGAWPWPEEVAKLRAARRPEPPTLKEQALEQLDAISTCFRVTHMGDIVCDKIRKALEQPND